MSNLEWSAYDKPPGQRSPDWYFAVGIIALSIAVISVAFNNVLFAVFIVISTGTLFLYTLQEPRLLRYEITNRGLRIEKTFRPFGAFHSFWVEAERESAILILKPKSITEPFLIISLAEANPEAVREALSAYLSEVEHREPFSKRIMEFLGF